MFILIYEVLFSIGGLKIWECTSDLLSYLITNPDDTNYEVTKVLDLGCGAGILGIYAFTFGAHVTFQDYVSILCIF